MNTLAILRGFFGNFRPLSLTTLACVSLHRDLYHYLECAVSPTFELYDVNEHPGNPLGVLSVTFCLYHWPLWLASLFIETSTITRNACYCQLVNAIMLMNTLEIPRGTFGNFRPLASTTLACVSLHRDLYHYLDCVLSPTCERYNVNEHPSNPSGYYGWLLWLASIFLENYTITRNARYRQLVNAIMLLNNLAILRGTFGIFWPLSLTT